MLFGILFGLRPDGVGKLKLQYEKVSALFYNWCLALWCMLMMRLARLEWSIGRLGGNQGCLCPDPCVDLFPKASCNDDVYVCYKTLPFFSCCDSSIDEIAE